MQILIKKVYDYTRALEDKFAPKPNYKRRQEVSALLDKQGKKKLLRLVDAHTMAREEMALASFIAGFHLAWGIAMELRTDGSYSYEREQEEINRRKNCEAGGEDCGQTQSQWRGQHPQTERWPLGRAVHGWPRPEY